MRIAVGSDLRTELTDFLLGWLREQGHEVELLGALKEGDERLWPSVGVRVAERVASGACDTGIALCWTGTGVCMAANKVPGVRAALCWDAETARGARLWDDANVLCLSLRWTSIPLAQEILRAWLGPLQGERDEEDLRGIRMMEELDGRLRGGRA